MNVAQWLNAIDLGQYEAVFREHEIDGGVLRDLVEADLEKIGVPLGHRKRLLRAIAALGTAETAAKPPSPAPVRSPATAERRLLTVMFCDLVGSTSLSAKLDAEDWRNLVSAYLDAASEAVTQTGGRVATKLGDGLMALFGHPIAQENDSERAVRAALAIQRALAELNRDNVGSGRPELVARIGVESGPVVVDAAGEIFGDAPNIAARVQALADPGTVLITARVQRQVAGLFVAEDLGARELRGVPEPIGLYRIVRASGGRRFGTRALTALVGREEELDLLRRRWERAARGRGQFVQIVGEPGIGKSRLVQEFRATLGETPHTFVELSSSQLLQNTSLHPIVEWGRQRFGADEPADRRLADLENTLRLIGLDPNEYGRLIAPLVDIPLPEELAAKFAPEELRRRQLAALTTWFLTGARSQPVALAFEDLHWADPTSLDLMQTFAERGARAPMLILATARPEFRPPWSLRSHHSVISLSPLDRADVARMVGELASLHTLSEEVVEGVSERTGGVPLFVEEVTRLLLERGEAGGLEAIPPTLQQSLAARLDRLGEAREVAQIGAVLGRDFTYALLRAVSEVEDFALQSALDRLAGADLLVVESAGHGAIYRFKHALIQDAAYESLLKSRRQTLHRRVAEILHDKSGRAAVEPEVIAHHFTEAGLHDLAIEWWGNAGDQALRRSAFQEAIAHLSKAIEMADKADCGKAARGSGGRAQLHVAYGTALFAVRGQGAPETTEAFVRAHKRAGGDKDAPERLAADYGLWAGAYQRGELAAMRELSAAFLSDAETRPDSPEAGVAHRTTGITHWFAGEYREARKHLEQSLALFQRGRDDDLAFRFGFLDSGVGAMALLAMALWPLGDIERAVSLKLDADARNAALPHAGARAHGKGVVAMFELMRGNLSRAASNGAELVQLAREHDLSLVLGLGVFLEGVATAESGSVADGLEQMRRGELLRGTNFPSYDGVIKIALAQAEARAGDVDRAIAILDEALATVQRTGSRAFEAELNRVRGEMRLKRDPASPAAAEESFRTAVAIAGQQAARSFELRAAHALANLYQSTVRPADAHAVLAPALEGFARTPEMPEIAEAQALLATLADTGEVKVAITQRERRLHLQRAYGQAMMWSKGYAAEETRAAFTRVRELASGTENAAERFPAYYARWVRSHFRGEHRQARGTAKAFFREAEDGGYVTEVGVARRCLGLTCLNQGDLMEARTLLERALADYQPNRDAEAMFHFGLDSGVAAAAWLAIATWHLGEVKRAWQLAEQAVRSAAELGHVPSRAQAYFVKTVLETNCGDPAAALRSAETLLALAREHGMDNWIALGEVYAAWARTRLDDPEAAAQALRRAVAGHFSQGNRNLAPLFHGWLAELEAATRRPDAALTLIDQGLAIAEETGERLAESYLHRLRGATLLKRDPESHAPAEQSFQTAMAIAKRQSARSYELLASLALAKLYESTDRPSDACAVLGPALDGFSPTPEIPEIAEAISLIERLA
jgi:class 3 adenylate cyclase/predicted ATPase